MKIRGYNINLVILNSSSQEQIEQITKEVYAILRDKHTNLKKGRYLLPALVEHKEELQADHISLFKTQKGREIIIECK